MVIVCKAYLNLPFSHVENLREYDENVRAGVLGAGCWVLEAGGCWVSGWVLGAGGRCQELGAGECWTRGAGCWRAGCSALIWFIVCLCFALLCFALLCFAVAILILVVVPPLHLHLPSIPRSPSVSTSAAPRSLSFTTTPPFTSTSPSNSPRRPLHTPSLPLPFPGFFALPLPLALWG